MSILDEDSIVIERLDKLSDEIQELIKESKDELPKVFAKGSVICVTTTSSDNRNLLQKVRATYGLPIDKDSFASKIQKFLKEQKMDSLSSHRNRTLVSLDFQALRRGDAWGFMKYLSTNKDDCIIVFENVTRIPGGNPSIYDDIDFIEDLLIKSWMYEDINVGGFHIDRRKLTIILTCPVEDSVQLKIWGQKYDYSCEYLDRLEKYLLYPEGLRTLP